MASFNERKYELIGFQGKVLGIVWATSVSNARKKARENATGTVNAVRETHFVRRGAKGVQTCKS